MKITDFKGEDALDVMAEIIGPASNVINDPEVKKLRSNKTAVAKYVLKNHKQDALAIYETLYQKDGSQATPIDLLKMIIDVLTDKDLLDLFTEQGQNEERTRSGSAMGNTEDGGR